MSLSIQGVVLPGDGLIEWRRDEQVAALVRTRLKAEIATHDVDDQDEADFLNACWAALDFVRSRGEHPGRSWEGAHVTWQLLKAVGHEVHSNAFNPIALAGVEMLNAALAAAGSPVGLLDTMPRGGPWELADGDATFFGGWDRATQRSVAAAIRTATTHEPNMALSELGRWVDCAIERDLTLWAWIA